MLLHGGSELSSDVWWLQGTRRVSCSTLGCVWNRKDWWRLGPSLEAACDGGKKRKRLYDEQMANYFWKRYLFIFTGQERYPTILSGTPFSQSWSVWLATVCPVWFIILLFFYELNIIIIFHKISFLFLMFLPFLTSTYYYYKVSKQCLTLECSRLAFSNN